MSRRAASPWALRVALVALAACAALRLAPGRATVRASGAAPLLRLPERLGPHAPGRTVALSPVERRLTAAPHVTIEKRSYGPTQVSLVTVSGGVREHHPPAVCLAASGYEVVSRTERQAAAGCVVELRVRQAGGAGRGIQLFTYSYLSDRGQITCSLYRRVGSAALAQLIGVGASRWATVQVLDADPQRARRTIDRLIQETTRRNDS